MKNLRNIFLTAVFLLCCHSAVAQQQTTPDTIQGFDVRYYRNCYWLDTTRVPLNSIYSSWGNSNGGMILWTASSQRVAYRFVPDRPLKIIGIAGVMTIGAADEQHLSNPIPKETLDSVLANRKTEYFELYGTRAYDENGDILQNTDTLVCLGFMPFSLLDSTRFIELPYPDPDNIDSIAVHPIIERYFPKAIHTDTVFYVGYTNFNHGGLTATIGNVTIAWDMTTRTRDYCLARRSGNPAHPYIYESNLWDSCKGFIVGGDNPGVLFQRPTSETHPYEPWTINPLDSMFTHTNAYSFELPLLFPIIDTMGMNIFPGDPDSVVCDTVEGFRVLDQQGNMAAFAWTQGNHNGSWQLSWGPEGIAPEDGTLVAAPTNVRSIVGLQDSVVYTAFVRARCNDTLYSEWSAPLRFWKGMPLSVQPANTVEQLTYLYPNPAENSVTVASSFAMSLVELFALDGTKLISHPTTGIVTRLDLASLPQGSYLLRITTPAGTAIKKLIKR